MRKLILTVTNQMLERSDQDITVAIIIIKKIQKYSLVVQKLLILTRSHLFISDFISNILGGGS